MSTKQVQKSALAVPGLAEAEARVSEILASTGEAAFIGRYLSSSRGKRLRPALVLLCGDATAGGGAVDVVDLAAAAEIVHLASLLHDDVVDGTNRRRGQRSVHAVWGNEAAVLYGDLLYTRALNIFAEVGGPEIVRTISSAIGDMAEGQILEDRNRYHLGGGEETYLEIADKKTASLLAACCEIGAIAAGAGAGLRRAVARFGRKLGMAFQITDDLLDFSAERLRWGKPVGQDLAAGKYTLPILRAIACSSLADRKRGSRWLLSQRPPLPEIRRWIKRYDGFGYSRSRAASFARSAISELAPLPPSPAKENLRRLAFFSVRRSV